MSEPITSLQNERVKRAARLRDSGERRSARRILIEGVREIGRALDGGIDVAEVFCCGEMLHHAADRELLARLENTSAEIIPVTSAVMAKLAYGQRLSPLLAVARWPELTLENIRLPAAPLVCVLEGVEKPGNVGAVVRTADAAGASALIVADGQCDLFNPNAIRASLGLLFGLPVASATTADTRAWLEKHGLAIYAARVDGKMPYTAADFTRPCAIVLGSEAAGLTRHWIGPGITEITLPMRGAGDSLNVSATAAVLLYEALRQRTLGAPPSSRE